MTNYEIHNNIRTALLSREPYEVEKSLMPLYQLSEIGEFINDLIELLNEGFHFKHEDIVRLFQEAKDPRTCQILKETTFKKFGYLNYDDSFGLARKCIWALADIGTSEAKNFLKEISETSNDIISKYATKRLENWDNELQRKGNS